MTESSSDKLKLCDEKIQKLVCALDKERDGRICVAVSYRNAEQQEEAFEKGLSDARWGQSPHNQQPSKAVDLAPLGLDGKINWGDKFAFLAIVADMKRLAKEMNIAITCGADFKKRKGDLGHFELVGWNL